MNGVVSLKAATATALCGPLAWLAWRVFLETQSAGSGLGADAGEALVHFLGEWALIMLLLAYSISPLRRLTGFSAVLRIRRMVGLFAFAYICLHLTSYITFYLGFAWQALLEDFVERTYITVGMAAFVLLLALAVTSTRGWQRRLRKNWQRLHRLIYPALVLALVHLWWLTKDGFDEVALFSAWFVILSAERLYNARSVKTGSLVVRPPPD